MQVPQLNGLSYHVDHAAPGNRHFPPQLVTQIHNLLDTVDIGGKAGHNNPFVFPPGKQHVEGFSHLAFTGRTAGLFRIGGIL